MDPQERKRHIARLHRRAIFWLVVLLCTGASPILVSLLLPQEPLTAMLQEEPVYASIFLPPLLVLIIFADNRFVIAGEMADKLEGKYFTGRDLSTVQACQRQLDGLKQHQRREASNILLLIAAHVALALLLWFVDVSRSVAVLGNVIIAMMLLFGVRKWLATRRMRKAIKAEMKRLAPNQ